jgi:hypothetical protein
MVSFPGKEEIIIATSMAGKHEKNTCAKWLEWIHCAATRYFYARIS